MENLAYQDPVWKELIDGKVVAMRSNITHSRIMGIWWSDGKTIELDSVVVSGVV